MTISVPIVLALLSALTLALPKNSSKLLQTIQSATSDGLRTCGRVVLNMALLLLAIQALRASGALAAFTQVAEAHLSHWHIHPDLIPLIIMRPFSGSASAGLFAALAHFHGGSAAVTLCAATILGSSETTLYVVSTYFASVGIKKSRYAIPLGLATECVGVIMALLLFPVT